MMHDPNNRDIELGKGALPFLVKLLSKERKPKKKEVPKFVLSQQVKCATFFFHFLIWKPSA